MSGIAPPGPQDERGYTLVEVLVAMVVLLVGVMGVLSMANGASRATSRTKAQEGATGLGRDMVETSRAVPYEDLTPDGVRAAFQARAGLGDSDPKSPGWQVARRGTTYTVAVSLCVFDDPRDGAGAHDATYCSDAGAAGTADSNPNDYKRVTFDFGWARDGRTERIRQATLVTNSDHGPAVTSLTTNPASNTTVTSGNFVDFSLLTSVVPSKVEWYLDGVFQHDLTSGITGGGTSYTFSWGIGNACSTGSVGDGTHLISGQAFNAGNSTTGQRAVTVRINRCAPAAPTSFAAGRNRWGVELNWEDNREDDVAGYRIFRGIGSAAPTQVASGPCSGVVKTSTCLEPDPSSTQSLVYNVRAVDRDTAGALRNGTASGNVTVVTNNRPPAAPVIGSASTYATIGWRPVTDPDRDIIDFYRIYRDGQALTDRYDVVDAVGDPIVWTDSNTGGSSHTYYVSAVDTRLGESALSNAVTR